MQRTIEVEHPGTHYPTDAQSRKALVESLKDESLKLQGAPEFSVVVNTSGGPSKVRATFEATERTKTVGGSKGDETKTVDGDVKPEGLEKS